MALITIQAPRLYPKQHAAIFDKARHSFIEASTKAGKAEPLDALVYTPSGPVQMGDICVGDVVLTPTGTSEVVGVYPQGEEQVYRLTFSDGSSVEASGEHLWEVHSYKAEPEVVTTLELMSWPQWKLTDAWVPPMEVVAQFDERPVPMDPYLLGILIADGGMTTSTLVLSTPDRPIVDRVLTHLRDLPPGLEMVKKGDRVDWRFRDTSRLGNRLHDWLRQLGLWGKYSYEKFIPDLYKYNSEHVRREVLRGILDGDGWLNRRGHPQFSTSSSQLCSDVREVLESLGGQARRRLKKVPGHRDAHCLAIKYPNPEELFWLERRRAKCRPMKRGHRRSFRSIEPTRLTQTQCIEIADERSLYLTDHFITTHNTMGCLVWQFGQCCERIGEHWWVAPVYAQAKIAFNRAKKMVPAELYRANESELTLTLVNGSVWRFRSGEKPDNLFGEDVQSCVIDEASRCREEVWDAIRSTLTATRGPTRVIGNVKGRKNWFYRLCVAARAGRKSYSYHKLTAYDAVDGGVLELQEIEDARHDLPDHVFKELYLAEAAFDGANPFGLSHIEAITVAGLMPGPVFCWGIDLAKHIDWTVLVGLNEDGDVCQLHRFQRGWRDTVRFIIATVGGAEALVDATGVGDPILEELQAEGGPNFDGFKFTPASKQQLMEGLALDIGQHSFCVPEGVLVDELMEFEYTYVGSRVRYEAPQGFHDDCVCGLALARAKYKEGGFGNWWS